jgi:hypothetical protein
MAAFMNKKKRNGAEGKMKIGDRSYGWCGENTPAFIGRLKKRHMRRANQKNRAHSIDRMFGPANS